MKNLLKKQLEAIGKLKSPIWFTEHHLAHAASAFYPSPYDEAAILTIDGVGEWATATIGKGKGNGIEIIKELHFPHSVGLLYSAITYYLGFQVNSGEYKLMGLSPYGYIKSPQTSEFKEKIFSHLVDVHEDGSICLNMEYFDFATGLKMTNNAGWEKLFGFPPRKPESDIRQEHMNLALAIQQVTEMIVIRMARHAREITGCRYLTLSGGVALNCVANGKLDRSGLFDDIWIQPAAGDAGGAIGAAFAGWHIGFGQQREAELPDGMKSSLLGPEFSNKEIEKTINRFNAVPVRYASFNNLCQDTAHLLSEGNVVGWFQGRMEFGPRALGNRSILGDPRNPEMQKTLNLKIKYREGFRPFAPAVVGESSNQYFSLGKESPYMLLVASVHQNGCNGNEREEQPGHHSIWDRLYQCRSAIPAVTHVDSSARVQTVNRQANPKFYNLLKEFSLLTGCDVLVNTSFNVRGEPMVCTPDDAYRSFMSTEMDHLVMGNCLFSKKDQPANDSFIKGQKGND
jgi:carbamoyltransferase